MKFMVAFRDSPEAQAALHLALTHAKAFGARVFAITSEEGGTSEKPEEIARIRGDLERARRAMEAAGVDGEVHEIVRGLSAGEDLIKFAEEKEIDHIFVGIEKKSKTRKILLGSTAQYIILKAPCPVTTVK